MGCCIDELAVSGDEVDYVSHDAEERDDEHGVHAGDDLGAEQRHEHPHARDADEERPAGKIALPAKGKQDGVAQLHGTHGQHAHQDEYPDERTDCGAVLAKDVVTGDDVVGKTLAKADLADEIRENEGKRERDGDGDAAELAARVEGDDTAAHEFGEA